MTNFNRDKYDANKYEGSPGDPREEHIAGIIQTAVTEGCYSDKRHSIEVGSGFVIWVKEVTTGKRVAYSSTKADFDQSLVEFVTDYFA